MTTPEVIHNPNMTGVQEHKQKLESPKLEDSSFGGCQGFISPNLVADMVKRTPKMKSLYDKVYVVDCRFLYEFESGHVAQVESDGWMTVCNFPPHNAEDAEQFFFGENLTRLLKGQCTDRICVIFHCEFSSKRAPDLRRQIRELDRKHNEYPKLCLPETYVMKGGYKAFWEEFPDLCNPKAYVSQWAKGFERQCKQSLLLMTEKKKKQKRLVDEIDSGETVRRLCY